MEGPRLASILLLAGAVTFAAAAGGEPAVGAAAFGPDGKLWRLLVEHDTLLLDSSPDDGETFDRARIVHRATRRLVATPEDRPQLGIAGDGTRYVLFALRSDEAYELHLTYQAAGSDRFSPPRPIGSGTGTIARAQATLHVSPSGEGIVLWTDLSGRSHRQVAEQGAVLYMARVSRDRDGPVRRLAGNICECCRFGIGTRSRSEVSFLGRFVYPTAIRDHGMLSIRVADATEPRRVTFDAWRIAGCPYHGPALSVGAGGRHHAVWFTQGRARKGLFYAHSVDGVRFSDPLLLGDPARRPAHGDVLSDGRRVVLVWQEHAGGTTQIRCQQSLDGGRTWTGARTVGETEAAADYPFLLRKGRSIFLSWNEARGGYRLIEIPLPSAATSGRGGASAG